MISNILFIYNFILIVLLNCTNSTLLSRYRIPNEYLSSSDGQYLQQLPLDMFDDLIEARPDLKQILATLQTSTLRHPVLVVKPRVNHGAFRDLHLDETENDEEYDGEETSSSDLMTRLYQVEESEEVYNTTMRVEVPDSPQTDNFTRILPFIPGPEAKKLRRFRLSGEDPKWKGRWKAVCYYCNSYYESDGGLKRQYYGKNIGGCFKRFLDLSQASRGGRVWTPRYNKRFTGHRYRRLEEILKGKKNTCISIPHASLVPLARGISLFTRYHVCVCETKYCNSEVISDISTQFIVVSFLLVSFLFVCFL